MSNRGEKITITFADNGIIVDWFVPEHDADLEQNDIQVFSKKTYITDATEYIKARLINKGNN